MEKTEIVKEIRKQKPIAALSHIRKGNAIYFSQIKLVDDAKTIHFTIPVSDMGDADFHPKMESQLLIRWLD